MTRRQNHISPAFGAAALIVLWPLWASAQSTRPGARVNLALHKPATASSIENDEHNASQANDGEARTCWRADDEPEGGPEWWQVDLQKQFDVSGCQIVWPYEGKNYRFKIQGSADAKNWNVLGDRTTSASRSQVQNVKFKDARHIRFVRVTITGFDEGCWASISEVKVFGSR